MRIALDARSVGSRVCGVSRVAVCLIRALSEIDRDNEYIVYVDSYVPSLHLGRNFRIKLTYCSRNSLLHDLKFYSILKSDKLNLYHSLHSWLPGLIPPGLKTVVTIHDLIAATDPDFFKRHKPFHRVLQMYFKYLTARAVRRADAIVTVSNHCKNELMRHFNLSPGKVNVVHNANGLSHIAFSEDRHRAANGNYLLYVGNCKSYKNVGTLLDGFHLFLSSGAYDIRLIIAGNDICDDFREKAKKLGIEDEVYFLTNLPDEHIGNLYANALAFIMPSKYEGFGIPVLEAMSFGVPVIISDAAALVEVAGDAALIFGKDSHEDLALAIERTVSDGSLRQTLIEKGLKRAQEFTWQSSAGKLKDLYQSVLES